MTTHEPVRIRRAAPEPEWADGSCAETDPEIFYPDKGGSTREPRVVCGRCSIRPECLEWALATDQRFGIWGGTSPEERKAIRRSRAAALKKLLSPEVQTG
ncbi:MAG TPA: WhiB family transcriptional regulator [Pseudonocardia sp.]